MDEIEFVRQTFAKNLRGIFRDRRLRGAVRRQIRIGRIDRRLPWLLQELVLPM